MRPRLPKQPTDVLVPSATMRDSSIFENAELSYPIRNKVFTGSGTIEYEEKIHGSGKSKVQGPRVPRDITFGKLTGDRYLTLYQKLIIVTSWLCGRGFRICSFYMARNLKIVL